MKTFVHVAFEGIDGSGKGLQIQLLSSELARRERGVVVTSEPSTRTELGRVIRDQFYDPVLSEAEMNVLFAAERIIHRRLWMPDAVEALAGSDDAIVLSDRSVWSAYAYHGVDAEWHKYLSPQSTWPDHTILLDVDPERALERVNESHARRGHDRWENIDRLLKARENYLELARLNKSISVIDGEGTVYEVASRVLKEFDSWRI